MHDLPNQTTGTGHLTILSEDPMQLLRCPLVQQLGGVGNAFIDPTHPHIELDARPKAEPSVLRIELMRAHAQVEQGAVQRLHVIQFVQDLVEAPLHASHAISSERQCGLGNREGLRIPVRRNDSAGGARLEEKTTVPTSTHGSIQIEARAGRSHPVHDFLGEYRLVKPRAFLAPGHMLLTGLQED
jgi:hypothetical protein